MSDKSYIDSVNNLILGNPILIFEHGSPLTSCETSFKNLFKNWTPANVTNAHEYELPLASMLPTRLQYMGAFLKGIVHTGISSIRRKRKYPLLLPKING